MRKAYQMFLFLFLLFHVWRYRCVQWGTAYHVLSVSLSRSQTLYRFGLFSKTNSVLSKNEREKICRVYNFGRGICWNHGEQKHERKKLSEVCNYSKNFWEKWTKREFQHVYNEHTRAWKERLSGIYARLGLYQKSHSFAVLTRSISDAYHLVRLNTIRTHFPWSILYFANNHGYRM